MKVILFTVYKNREPAAQYVVQAAYWSAVTRQVVQSNDPNKWWQNTIAAFDRWQRIAPREGGKNTALGSPEAKMAAEGVNEFAGPDMGVLIITHYQRILHLVEPDFVHVMFDGRIVKEGGPELVSELEAKGYGWIREEVEAAA